MLTTKFLLQVLAVAVGGGTVQLLIFLLKRRTELRALDRTSEASLLSASITDGQTLRAEIAELKEEVRQIRAERDQARESAAAQLETAHRENRRLTYEIATLRTDLDIATRQIEDLKASLTARRRR
jgi:septal ring factor EnvC (AmiA/AmiB activator)